MHRKSILLYCLITLFTVSMVKCASTHMTDVNHSTLCNDSLQMHKHLSPEFCENKARRVLNLLDLTLPRLEEVKEAHDKQDIPSAFEKLFLYYRNEHQAKHPELDRSTRRLSQNPTAQDIQWADDALQHVFVGQRNLPSLFRGWDIDWKTNPVDDIQWIHQFHRMYWWDSMGKMYWYTKKQTYAQEYVDQLLDWASKNPTPETNAFAWTPLQVGCRLARFVDTFEYFIDAPAYNPSVLLVLLENIYTHNEYLLDNYNPEGNRVVIEARGALSSSIYFSEFKNASKWRHKAVSLLNTEIEKQVLPDGMHSELSLSYHKITAREFIEAYSFAVVNGLDAEFSSGYKETIRRMGQASYKTLLPDLTMPQFGDGWKQKSTDFFKQLDEVLDDDELRYFATERSKGKTPKDKSFALMDSGFYAIRGGWSENDVCMVLKCGPKPGYHAHPDNGSFELYALGKHFMPDSGCYTYNGDLKLRRWFRRSSNHQTLTLNNNDINCAPELLMWLPSAEVTTLVLENKSYTDLIHRRAVFFIDQTFFVIVDTAKGDAKGNVSIHFQFKEGPALFDEKTLCSRTNFKDGKNLLVKTTPQPGIQLKRQTGWVSYEYDKKIERPAFAYMVKKDSEKSDVNFITVLLPYKGIMPEVSIEEIKIDNQRIAFSVKTDRLYSVDCNLNSKKSELSVSN